MELGRIDEDLRWYKKNVRPLYEKMDPCHDEDHYDEVVQEAYELGGVEWGDGYISTHEYRILMAAAAYHDIGRIIDNETHEMQSARMIDEAYYCTEYLYKTFSKDDIATIKRVILEHRSSIEPSDEMSAILKDADKVSRRNEHRALSRVIGYNLKAAEDASGDTTENMISIMDDYYANHKNAKIAPSYSHAARELYGEEKTHVPHYDKKIISDIITEIRKKKEMKK